MKELMAKDLHTNWIPDQEMYELLKCKKDNGDASSSSNYNKATSTDDTNDAAVDVLLIGSDCILPQGTTSMGNKVGTKRLCEIAQTNNIPVFCCADTWKVWDDIFPPPIETDLFEFVPLNLVTKLLLPSLPPKI